MELTIEGTLHLHHHRFLELDAFAERTLKPGRPVRRLRAFLCWATSPTLESSSPSDLRWRRALRGQSPFGGERELLASEQESFGAVAVADARIRVSKP
ncbi:unnamed protein product [Sphagnum tenellum]